MSNMQSHYQRMECDRNKQQKNMAVGNEKKVMTLEEFTEMINNSKGNILYTIAMGEQVEDGKNTG